LLRDDKLKGHLQVKHNGEATDIAALRAKARKRFKPAVDPELYDEVLRAMANTPGQLTNIQVSIARIEQRLVALEGHTAMKPIKTQDDLSLSQTKRFNKYLKQLGNSTAARYLATCCVAKNTRKVYCTNLLAYLKSQGDITRELILDFFNKREIKAKYSLTTLKGIKRTLKALCADELGWGKRDFPKMKLSSSKTGKADVYIPSKAEVDKLIEELESKGKAQLSLLIQLMFISALRPIDMVSLIRDDFRTEASDFVLRKTESKTGKQKVAFIPKELYEKVKALPDQVLFPFLTRKGYRIQLKRLFDSNCEIDGHKLVPKAIRKASITFAYQKGGIKEAKAQGAHSTQRITMEHYIDKKTVSKRMWRGKKTKKDNTLND